MSDNSAPAAGIARKMSDAITLAEPIERGGETITSIQLRKPKAGELRGLSIQELMNARVSAILDVVPRISVPPLTAAEANNLETQDINAIGGAIIDFFLTPSERMQMERVLSA